MQTEHADVATAGGDADPVNSADARIVRVNAGPIYRVRRDLNFIALTISRAPIQINASYVKHGSEINVNPLII